MNYMRIESDHSMLDELMILLHKFERLLPLISQSSKDFPFKKTLNQINHQDIFTNSLNYLTEHFFFLYLILWNLKLASRGVKISGTSNLLLRLFFGFGLKSKPYNDGEN